MQMAFKANPIIPALLTKCLFVSFQLYLVYLVKSTGYIMKIKIGIKIQKKIVVLASWKQLIAIIININANCQIILISSHVNITLM